MEAAIITTYRCSNRCYMCNIWKYPTKVEEEFKPELLNKLPKLSFCNITGGEPFLRDDLEEIVSILKKKAKRIVISTNGYFTERIMALAKKYKDIGIRVSIEGLASANDELRGIKDGFDHGLRTLLELKRLGFKDIGFGITVSDRNALDMIELYQLAKAMNVEFATAVVHNSYYFHKYDNRIDKKEEMISCFEELIKELLETKRLKNWFRAYFNYGLINYIKGNKRLLPCQAGTENLFLDPYGEIRPCNGMEESIWFESMGNLKEKTFDEIWNGEKAKKIREKVKHCPKNCWMIGTAAPVMKKYIWKPTFWVLKKKLGGGALYNSSLKTPNSKLKIAVLGTRGFPEVQGGVEAHCESLYPHLVKNGCEVVVFTRKPYINPEIDTYKGVKLVSLPCPRNKFLEAFLHTFIGVFAAKKIHPDILHIHAIGPALFIPLARLLGMKVIMTHHGPDYQRKKWNRFAKGVLKFGEYLGCRWANEIICISESIAERIQKKYKRKVIIIPNGVIIPEVLKTDNTLKKYGLAKGRYILSVGRFVPEKGFLDLIDAFNELNLDSWKLVIVGRADHEDRYSLDLKEKATKFSNIILTGFLTGIPLQELYSHARIFVLPSYYEGLPITLLEAMSYGLPCLASDIPANKDVGLSEERFFKPGNPRALSRKIREFVNKPLNEEELSEQLNILVKRYDWKRIADKTFEVYHQEKNAPNN